MTDAPHPDRRPDAPAETSTSSLIGDVLARLSSLIRSEFDLARSEVDRNLRRAQSAIGMIVVAVALALTALNVLAAALVAAIEELGVDAGWAAVIVAVVMALVAWLAMSRGLSALSLSSLAPSRTAENVKRDAQAVAGASHDR